MTHVAGVGISLFRLAECERRERELVGFLSDEEERESRSFSSRERRRDFVASRALVRVLLSADWRDTVAPRDWRIGHTDLGKLTVHGPAGENGIDVSISHSDRALAIAVSDAFDVGVDLEPSRRRGQDPVVWSALSAAEQKTLVGRPAVDRSSRFLRMWTLKEAYAKCSGAGSSLSFADLHTSFDPLAVTPSGDQSAAARYRFHQQEWSLERDRHWVAIAVASRPSG